MTYAEAGAELGVGYPHLMLLLREGRLRRGSDGGVTPGSVAAYKALRLPPENGDWISGGEAAAIIGIARRHIPLLVDKGLVKGVNLPNSIGGFFVDRQSLDGLDMKVVGRLGIKIRHPDGWLDTAETCRRLRVDRFRLRDYVRRGLITQLKLSSRNAFYLEEDVDAVTTP